MGDKANHGRKRRTPDVQPRNTTSKWTGKQTQRSKQGHSKNKPNSLSDVSDLFDSSRESRADDLEEPIFPSGFMWIVWIVTLGIRMYLILRQDSGWILHPDEVFQSVEVAHSMVYGYGFRPYEYLPPPDRNSSVAVERQEAATGMYSLRSFIYPQMFATLLWTTEYLGISGNPFKICRVFHTIVAAHLPVSVYVFMRRSLARMSGAPGEQRDVSIICSVLVAFSQQLTILGTHSVVNSFLAPFTFLALASFISVTQDMRKLLKEQVRLESSSKLFDELRASDDSGISSDNDTSHEHTTNRPYDAGAKSTVRCFSEYRVIRDGKNSSQRDAESTKAENRHVVYLVICTRQSLRTLHTFYQSIKSNCIQWITGLTFGLLVYIRPDQILLVAIVCAQELGSYLLTDRSSCELTWVLHVTLGAVVGVLCGGLQDYTSYGVCFLSPQQWFSFNVRRGMSSVLFGSQDLSFYVREMFKSHCTKTYVICVLSMLLVCVLRSWLHRSGVGSWKPQQALKHLVVPFIILLSLYSMQKHKELRFVHNIFVLFHMILGVSLYTIFSHLAHSRIKRIITYTTLLFYVCHCYNSIPSPENKSNMDWAYLQNWDSGSVNECLEFVGQQSDASGVFLDRSIHISGGYSVLHKNIPVFSLVHYEFQEFGLSSRSRINETSWIDGSQVSIAKLNRVSNFVTTENSPLLLKQIIIQKEYNYLVTKRTREVINVGFEEVFTSGTMRVLRRTYAEQAESKLQRIADSIPLGTNSTVLEYESSWLYTLGLYQKAIDRLTYSMEFSEPRVRVFQLLAMCYNALGQRDKARDIYDRCVSIYGDSCSRPQPKVVLHSDYNLDIKL